jgi:membrane associated rhomboid family serine protease
MPRAASFAFPPFTRTVKLLIGINLGFYFLMLLMRLVGQGAGANDIGTTLALIPVKVIHGWVWQIVTYSFIHAGFFHVFFNMLALWMFGATMEQHWGRRQFLEFYFFAIIGGALTTIAIAYGLNGALGLTPTTPTVGASAGVYGILLAFGWYYGEQDVFMFPLPFSMKAKYMVAILILIAIAGALGDPAGGTANIAHLGGLFFAFLYLKFLPRRGFAFMFSEGFYGMRNSYHRWKFRRAARKFEVWRRQNDPGQYFDEYGNFRPPDDNKKKEDGKGGWVN